MAIQLVTTAAQLRAASARLLAQKGGTSQGLVPTMGALHEGHAQLARTAVAQNDVVAATIFVNPLQFGEAADLERYPRTLDADLALLDAEGVDLAFAPGVEEVYPGGAPLVRITAGPLGEKWEGASRPGHFDGALTVVAKLLHYGIPGAGLPGGGQPAYRAYFGQKDAQQLALVRRMVLDLNLPVEVVAVPTEREPDGLARSSRNRYLSAQERVSALALSRALFAGAAQRTPDAIRDAAREVLTEAGRADPPVVLDYLALLDPRDFTEVADPGYTGPAVLAVAAKVGTTRLIDNLPLEIGA